MENKELTAFKTGDKNVAFEKYFIGQSYLNTLTDKQMHIANVTFEPSCRNNWHIHNADKGGGQILIVTYGEGWYQEENKLARKLKAGDIVNIMPGVKHWHGAAKNSWFQHIAIEVPGENTSNEWLEEVNDDYYNKLED